VATKEAVMKSLDKVRAKFEDRGVQTAFQGFNKSVQFLFPDLNVAYVMTVTGGVVTDFREGTVKTPGILLSMDSETFLGIQNKELVGATALGQGKITITGIVGDLLLLEKYLV